MCTFSITWIERSRRWPGLLSTVGTSAPRGCCLRCLSEPGDSVTGRMLNRLGGVETVGLLDRDDAAPGVGLVETQVWRRRLLTQVTEGMREKVAAFEGMGYGTVIPGDDNWPAALAELNDRAPYVLWTTGAASFLSRPSEELVTITGARAATGYGENVAIELASDMSNAGKIVVSGGAYGIENAAHRAVLAAGGDTIAVLAAGVDRSYPQGQMRRAGFDYQNVAYRCWGIHTVWGD